MTKAVPNSKLTGFALTLATKFGKAGGSWLTLGTEAHPMGTNLESSKARGDPNPEF